VFRLALGTLVRVIHRDDGHLTDSAVEETRFLSKEAHVPPWSCGTATPFN
jgi:hypothetical protein